MRSRRSYQGVEVEEVAGGEVGKGSRGGWLAQGSGCKEETLGRLRLE